MAVTMCTSGAVVLKAGANATVFTDAQYTQLINQAEAVINNMTRIDYTAAYSGLSSGAAVLFEEVCSNLAGMYAIQYDMSGFTSRFEAQTMLDVLRDGAMRGLQLIKDKKVTDFIDGA